MVGYKDTPGVAKKSCWSCLEERAITSPWWVLSIIEVRKQLGWGIGSKPNAQDSKQNF